MTDAVEILLGRDLLRLAKEALSNDHEGWRREQARRFVLQSYEVIKKSYSSADLPAFSALTKLVDAAAESDVSIIWDAIAELEEAYAPPSGLRRKVKVLTVGLARDLGVVLLTLMAVFIGFRKYHNLPVNLWDKSEAKSNFNIISAKQSYGQLEFNRTVEKYPIKLGGVNYFEGWGTHADSEILAQVIPDAKFFSGACGYPDSARGNAIRCSIWFDSVEVWRSKLLNNTNPIDRFRIALNGNKKVIFRVTSGQKGIVAAHAVWVDLRLTGE